LCGEKIKMEKREDKSGWGIEDHMVSFRGIHASQELEDSVYFYFR